MAPFDLISIRSIDAGSLSEDNLEEFFKTVSQYEIKDSDEREDICNLFYVTKAVLKSKDEQTKILIEELEKAAISGGEFDALQNKYLLQIDDLKHQIKEYQNGVPGPSTSSSSNGTSHLRSELQDLKHQIDDLEKELKSKEIDLLHEKNESERYMSRCDDLEKKSRDQHREINQLKDDIISMTEQLKKQGNADDDDIQKEHERVKKMNEKNRQIHELINDLDKVEEEKTVLVHEVSELKDKLNEATKLMDRTTNEYINLKEAMKDAEIALKKLQTENELLLAEKNESKISDCSGSSNDDEIMRALNENVEYWKTVLLEKNSEMIAQNELINELKDKISAISVDTDRTSVAVLTKALADRDQQIMVLKEQLNVASNDIDENIEIINNLKKDIDNGVVSQDKDNTGKLAQDYIEMKTKLQQAEQQRLEAEEDALVRDKELADVKSRMRQYELGEYGLAEAVNEIKGYKTQITIRDRQIEELTHVANNTELQLNELIEENEDLREKLGLDPKSPSNWKLSDGNSFVKYTSKIQKERALIHILQQENIKLEEERIELKLKIRQFAQLAGQRASSSGLNNDDLQVIQDFKNSLNEKKYEDLKSEVAKHLNENESHKQVLELKSDLKESSRELDVLKSVNTSLQLKVDELEKENKNLELGLKEIHQSMKDQEGSKNVSIHCPSLQNLIALFESKNTNNGKFDSNLHLKSQLDVYVGRCEQLQTEMKQTHQENINLLSQVERYKLQLKNLEDQVKIVQHCPSQPGGTPILSLPQSLPNSSAAIINSLNSHLLQVLHELSLERDTLIKHENSLEESNRKLNVLKHQMGLLYQQYAKEKDEWKLKYDALNKQIAETKAQKAEDDIKIGDYERLLNTLEQDDSELKRRLADTSRRITKHKVDENKLNRKYSLIQESECNLLKQNKRLQNEITLIENNLIERIGFLNRIKDMSNFKIAAMQKLLDDAIPKSEFEKANRDYEALSRKYRDILEDENHLVAQKESQHQYQMEIQHLEKENAYLKGELELLKEKIFSMEAVLENLKKQGIETTVSDVEPLSKRLATLEMKELNERQRANHSQNLYEQQRLVLQSLEDRNNNLETKFKELTKINLEQQDTERKIREELANCVSAEINAKNETKIEEQDKKLFQLSQEVSKLKEIADIARNQTEMIEVSNKLQEKEVTALQSQILELQSSDDEKALIGKLYRQILNLQLSEGMAMNKLNKAYSKIAKMEEACLKLEHICEERNQELYHVHRQGSTKVDFLNKIIHELRRQFSGAIPLRKQEQFTEEFKKLQEDRHQAQQALQEARKQRIQVEDKLASIDLQRKGLEQLISTLKDGDASSKVIAWHEKMQVLKLKNLKDDRLIARLNEKITHFEVTISAQVEKIEQLETDYVKQASEMEKRELFWENREKEHETALRRLTSNSKEIVKPLAKFETQKGIKPAPTNAENKYLKELNLAMEKINNFQQEISTKDVLISDLRLKLIEQANMPCPDVSNSEKNLTAAKATISSLKMRLEQKEASVKKYEEMLRKANLEYEEINNYYTLEITKLQKEAEIKRESYLNNFRDAMQKLTSAVNQDENVTLSNKQLTRLNELEDIVSEQEHAMSELAANLQKSRNETANWKHKLNEFENISVQKMSSLKEEHSQQLIAMEDVIKNKEKQLTLELSKIDSLMIQLDETTNRPAPIQNPEANDDWKSLVSRSKRQLSEKEKQLQALSRALAELRLEMLNMAQQNLVANQNKVENEQNVEALIRSRTEKLRRNIEDLVSEKTDLLSKISSDKHLISSLKMDIESLKSQLTSFGKLNQDTYRIYKDSDVESMQEKIERLQDQLIKQQIQPAERLEEKHYEFEKQLKTREEIIKLEQRKKFQKAVDRIKEKLKLKEDEVINLQKECKSIRDQLCRCEKEKLSLSNKLKSVSRPSSVQTSQNVSQVEVKMLKKQIENYEIEMDNLKKEVKTGEKKLVEELKSKIKFLEEKLKLTQRSLAKQQLKVRNKYESGEEVNFIEEKLESQSEVVRLSEKNLELQLELQKCRIEIPQLKDQITDLKENIQFLQSTGSTSPTFSQQNKKVVNKSKSSKVNASETYRCDRCKSTDELQSYLTSIQNELKGEKEHVNNLKSFLKEANVREIRLVNEIEKLQSYKNSPVSKSNINSSQLSDLIAENKDLRSELQKLKSMPKARHKKTSK